MVDPSIAEVVVAYLRAVQAAGIHAHRAVVFGSHARGDAGPWSDIDVVVIAPELESPVAGGLVDKLWELRAFTDSRIEPTPCGEREWDRDDSRPILVLARREGVEIAA